MTVYDYLDYNLITLQEVLNIYTKHTLNEYFGIIQEMMQILTFT